MLFRGIFIDGAAAKKVYQQAVIKTRQAIPDAHSSAGVLVMIKCTASASV